MVKVERVSEPQSLLQNGADWTRALMAQIGLLGDFSRVPSRFKDRYNQDDVKNSLEIMYGEKCCFCEGHIGVCSYEHIEHRMPKSKFPDQAFAWGNLHWSCQICNVKKGDKWSESAPILDPAVDDPDEHLEFDLESCTILPKNSSFRAQTTIDHTNLNRPKLVEARKRVKRSVTKLLLQASMTTSPMDQEFYRNQLRELTINDPDNGQIAEHSMFVKKLLEDISW